LPKVRLVTPALLAMAEAPRTPTADSMLAVMPNAVNVFVSLGDGHTSIDERLARRREDLAIPN